mgnify:CR=1 FL=1|tara:strand:- start:524 stop:1168 length:645 start_codon:yes stop_codon:yes gene_type:complete
MSDETQIISNEQKNKDLKNIFFNNKKSIISIIIFIFVGLFGYFFYLDYKDNKKIKISEQYSLAVTNYNNENVKSSIIDMKDIINEKDVTYSPLALYFLLDNNLITNKTEINQYFNIMINEVSLDQEIKNLIIYKKGLYNSNTANEQELLSIFQPLISSDNLWRSHSLYVIAEYYYSKNEKNKSKEFFEKILNLEKPNSQIKIETQKRLQRDFSD